MSIRDKEAMDKDKARCFTRSPLQNAYKECLQGVLYKECLQEMLYKECSTYK